MGLSFEVFSRSPEVPFSNYFSFIPVCLMIPAFNIPRYRPFSFLSNVLVLDLAVLSLAYWLECSLLVRETEVQSSVESYQRLKKWYLIAPHLTLSYIRYVSRVKWSNPGKGVAPSPTPRCSSY